MSGRCKNCIYWWPVEDEEDHLGSCTHAKINCTEPEADDAMFVESIDDYPVILTGEEFGCVHFKEDDNASTT